MHVVKRPVERQSASCAINMLIIIFKIENENTNLHYTYVSGSSRWNHDFIPFNDR